MISNYICLPINENHNLTTTNLLCTDSIFSSKMYVARSPPPVRPSRSLEGVEQVVPPTLPATTYNATSTPTTTTSPSSTTVLFSTHVYPPSHGVVHRHDMGLNKPLPARPLLLHDEPEISVMWSDSSDSDSDHDDDDHDSMAESVSDRRSNPRYSSESYPIFVSTDSDYDDVVDRHAPANAPSNPGPHVLRPGRIHSPSPPTTVADTRSRTDSILSLSHQDALSGESDDDYEQDEEDGEDEEAENGENGSSMSAARSIGRSLTSNSDPPYGRYSQWSQTRGGTNHYFREKKWDFFPELAPSAAQPASLVSTGSRASKSRRKEGRLNASRRRKWQSLDRAGLGLAFGMRDSIKTYVHRTLSRDSGESKARDIFPRPSTAPVDQLPTPGHLKTAEQGKYVPNHDLNGQLHALSISTASVGGDLPPSPASPRSFPPRPKQLAVPMTNYQRYGPAIWESPNKSKSKTSVSNPSSPITGHFPGPSTLTPPHSPATKLFSQSVPRDGFGVPHGKHSVTFTLEGAKKKISKDERRREQLKAQIKLIGPVDPYTCMRSDSTWDRTLGKYTGSRLCGWTN